MASDHAEHEEQAAPDDFVSLPTRAPGVIAVATVKASQAPRASLPPTSPNKRRQGATKAPETPPPQPRGIARTMLLKEFAARLYSLMCERELNASGLARELWGTTTNEKGYEVAKGRERIHYWLKGRQLPDSENLGRLAHALRTRPEALVPIPSIEEQTDGEYVIQTIPGYPDKLHLRVDKVMDKAQAARIIALLADC